MGVSWAAALDIGGHGGELWGAALRVFVALVVILPLVYGVTLLYSRRFTPGGVGRAIRVIDAVSLGSNRTICLIEVDDRIIVVGVTPQQISTLAEMTEPDAVERLRQLGPRAASRAFSKLIESRLGAGPKPKDGRDGN